ncbi:MAG TPA: chemotaxis response regulator protein-glutamate methylesterase [Candidatus Wallbacteria bacterium]|nr:chemotaxis response regulator protein-glutamate methylesterase [Candidatus Wallbacteria bacterium]
MENNKITALVVDDSPLMRKLVSDILTNSGRFRVLDTCQNGQIALQKIESLNPDVITLDVDMPVMDGFTCLKKIMEVNPRPVVMLSGLTQEGAVLTIRCLEVGAFDFVSKPLGGLSKDIEQISTDLVEKLVEAHNNKHRIALKKYLKTTPLRQESASPIKKPLFSKPIISSSNQVVGIGISTGGPVALRQVIPMLPPDFPGTVLVQHMPDTFTKAFADRLNSESQVEVKEAEDGDLVRPGRVLVAPGNYHMKVKKDRGFLKVLLSKEDLVSGHRPSVDVLFKSLAEEVGAKTLAVIMTGMGRDGATGLGLIKDAGGYTMAQDETSCTVFGMPKMAIKEGAAMEVVHLSKISTKLLSIINQKNGEK